MTDARWSIECVQDVNASICIYGSWDAERQGPLPVPFWEVMCGCGNCKSELRVVRDEKTAHQLVLEARVLKQACLNDVAPTHCQWLFCDDNLFDACGVLWPPEPLNGRHPGWRTE